MTKNDYEDFGNTTKSWICENIYVVGDVKLWYHCHIPRKY